jgi:hypothetical protein
MCLGWGKLCIQGKFLKQKQKNLQNLKIFRGLRVWRKAANILNGLSQTAERRWSSSMKYYEGSCARGNETFGYINGGEFLHNLSDCQALKTDSPSQMIELCITTAVRTSNPTYLQYWQS